MRYLLVTILALSASAFAQTDEQRAAIADRIKSFSNVCVSGQDCGGASVAAEAVAAEAAQPGAGNGSGERASLEHAVQVYRSHFGGRDAVLRRCVRRR